MAFPKKKLYEEELTDVISENYFMQISPLLLLLLNNITFVWKKLLKFHIYKLHNNVNIHLKTPNQFDGENTNVLLFAQNDKVYGTCSISIGLTVYNQVNVSIIENITLKYLKLVCEEVEPISLANTNIRQNLIIPIIY